MAKTVRIPDNLIELVQSAPQDANGMLCSVLYSASPNCNGVWFHQWVDAEGKAIPVSDKPHCAVVPMIVPKKVIETYFTTLGSKDYLDLDYLRTIS